MAGFSIMDLITAKDAAKRLGVHIRTVCRMCASGKLRAVKEAGRWLIDGSSIPQRFIEVVALEGPLDTLELSELCSKCRIMGMQKAANAVYRRFGQLNPAITEIGNLIQAERTKYEKGRASSC